MAISVVVCKSGMARHDPDLTEKVESSGGRLSTVDCFDRCEQCERAILVRLDGTMTRFWNSAQLLEALGILSEEEEEIFEEEEEE